ncbi:MAG: glycosyltransferase family 9 protein [Gemmatimonadota bacterium]
MALRDVENGVRRLILSGLSAVFGGGVAPKLPDWGARPYRVLFIRDDGIGDFIVSIEIMRAIAEASPTITFDILASPQNAPVARTLPFVNEVIVHKREFLLKAAPLWARLRRNRYDAVVDGRVAVRNVNMQTSCLLLATGAPWRIGLVGRGNDQVYTVRIPEKDLPHWTDQVVALAGPFGVQPKSRDWRPHIPMPDALRAEANATWLTVGSGKPRVLVNLSVGHPERWWPPEKYAPVLRRVRDRLPDSAIMIVGMPAELAAADALAVPAGAKVVSLRLHQVLAAVATADLLISPDTSVTHAASAFETTTLCLQRKDTGQWSPYKTLGRVVFSDDPKRVAPLPSERVVAALDSLIDEFGPARGWV